MKNRVTPEMVTKLEPNQMFVFGSNLQGHHVGGAAKLAHDDFGAKWGTHEGVTGKCYAIPTVDLNKVGKMKLLQIEFYIQRFIKLVKNCPNKVFLVTEIGCGIAGFTPNQIAPMFKDCVNLNNVSLPERFWNVLNKE